MLPGAGAAVEVLVVVGAVVVVVVVVVGVVEVWVFVPDDAVCVSDVPDVFVGDVVVAVVVVSGAGCVAVDSLVAPDTGVCASADDVLVEESVPMLPPVVVLPEPVAVPVPVEPLLESCTEVLVPEVVSCTEVLVLDVGSLLQAFEFIWVSALLLPGRRARNHLPAVVPEAAVSLCRTRSDCSGSARGSTVTSVWPSLAPAA